MIKLPDIPPTIEDLIDLVDWNIGQLLKRISMAATIAEVYKLSEMISEIQREFKNEILKYNN